MILILISWFIPPNLAPRVNKALPDPVVHEETTDPPAPMDPRGQREDPARPDRRESQDPKGFPDHKEKREPTVKREIQAYKDSKAHLELQ